MMSRSDLPSTIAVFPLPGAVLLPRARLPLHLFEPRYLAMLDDVLKTPHRMIGMVQPMTRADGAKDLHAIGCAGRVTGFSETSDGRYLITLGGVSRFRILSEVEGFTPYRRADISWEGFENDMGPAENDAGFDRDGFLALLRRYLAAREMDAEWGDLDNAEDEVLINSLSMLCPLEPEEKQALLEAPSLPTRRKTLATLLEIALHGRDGEDSLQ